MRLTDAVGYDAEASYSPDGTQIVLASNRAAYERELSPKEKELFALDPASMIDIYIMNADGTNVRRLTNVLGYDGGPFFSADGTRICWRRFTEDGATAEIYSMKTDGTDVRRLTSLRRMSWAPYFHPSGQYLIFTTNKHGFDNFELYIVRADGQEEPVRVSERVGFDGLPVLLPDGERLSWTSNATPGKRSQIFMADWNHETALERLNLNENPPPKDEPGLGEEDANFALAAAQSSQQGYKPSDIIRHVDFLTRAELGGRLTGTAGEKRATA